MEQQDSQRSIEMIVGKIQILGRHLPKMDLRTGLNRTQMRISNHGCTDINAPDFGFRMSFLQRDGGGTGAHPQVEDPLHLAVIRHGRAHGNKLGQLIVVGRPAQEHFESVIVVDAGQVLLGIAARLQMNL